MGGTSKQLMTLLSSQPFPLLYPRPSALRLILHSRISALSSLSKHRFSTNNYRPLPQFGFSVDNSSSSPQNNFNTRNIANRGVGEFYASFFDPPPSESNSSSISNFRFSHPWPEWVDLVDNLRLAGYFNHPQVPPVEEDAFSVFENLPQDFVQAASACLSFARQRSHLLESLSRKDIEVVVQNGSPFLFKSALESATRMKSFLASRNHQNNELLFERAHMVDLMRFLLTYVYNSVVSGGPRLSSGEQIESSVRNLLRELASERRVVQESDLSSSMPKQFPDGYGQPSRPIKQNIEMKRGDWICPKCTFMNFARNMNCLECNESRPKGQLTGGEWNCPQCDFFNYGRNTVCIRCDCRRPAEVSSGSPTSPRFGFETPGQYHQGTSESKNLQSMEMGPGRSSGLNRNVDRSPEYVPFKPLPSDMFNKDPNNNLGLARKPVVNQPQSESKEESEKSERWFKTVSELHDVTDISNAISDEDFPEIMPMRKGENRFVVSKKKDRSLTKNRNMAMDQQTNSSTNFVPFVPFPPDYFAKKDKLPEQNSSSSSDSSTERTLPGPGNNIGGGEGQELKGSWKGGFTGKSLEGSLVKEGPDPLDMSEEAKAERWFRRAAQIKDISELSQIPDEDFPSIMPMRKGVNRFVVSKRKTPLERRLTSPQYRRNLPIVSSQPTSSMAVDKEENTDN